MARLYSSKSSFQIDTSLILVDSDKTIASIIFREDQFFRQAAFVESGFYIYTYRDYMEIRFTDRDTTTLYGDFDSGSDLKSGTLRGIKIFDALNLDYLLIDGVSVSFEQLNSEDTDYIAIMFQGNDEFYLSDYSDYANSYEGDDLVLGQQGNDIIFGGSGNDILYGGYGPYRGSFVFTFLRQTYESLSSGDDYIYGQRGDDLLYGENGDDYLEGGSGNDEINGGEGFDTVGFTGKLSEYSFAKNSLNITITDSFLGRDGIDSVREVEFLKFADQTVSTNTLPSYLLLVSTALVSEGSSAIFTLTSAGVVAGTRVAYTLSGVSSADIQGGSLAGTATIGADGKAIISIPILADSLTEGAETLTVSAAGKTASITINDTSLSPIASYVIIASSSAVNEGSSAIFVLGSAGVVAGTRVAYTFSGVSSADIQGGLLNGTVIIGSDGKSTISVPILADNLTEGRELLTVNVGGKSASSVVNDTSIGTINKIFGTNSDQKWTISANSYDIDGGLGIDTVQYLLSRSSVSVSKNNLSVFVSKDGATDRLTSIERVDFTDGDLIFDITSALAPAAYRLYGGAFDRTPDEGGFRYWTQTLDSGVSLNRVAASFIVSKEFTDRYGNNVSNKAFVDALYTNVLDRPGETAGVSYWNEVLDKKLADRADVLVSFTQLPEYVGLSMKDIENGYWVV
jgi:hypothetical protein